MSLVFGGLPNRGYYDYEYGPSGIGDIILIIVLRTGAHPRKTIGVRQWRMRVRLISRRGLHRGGKDATRNGSYYFRHLPRRAASDPEAPKPIGGQPRPVKPRLRGVSHRWTFFASLFAGVALILVAPNKRAVAAAMVYALSLSALFGVSALYHLVTWSVPVRRRMRRLDHSMIFLLIAGTYTPFGMLVLQGTLARVVLTVVWGGAILGMVLNLVWIDAPKWFSAIVYISLGWVAVATFPELLSELGATATGLLVLGGVLYSAGAAVYALRRPDPAPEVFGYHEVFHALVIAATVAHYAVVAFYVLPHR